MGWVNNKGANSAQMFEDGGKVKSKKKRKRLKQNDKLKAIQAANHQMNKDIEAGKYKKDGKFQHKKWKADDDAIRGKLKEHKANPDNYEEYKKGGKTGNMKGSPKKISSYTKKKSFSEALRTSKK